MTQRRLLIGLSMLMLAVSCFLLVSTSNLNAQAATSPQRVLSITVQTFFDKSGNGRFEVGELPLEGISITLTPPTGGGAAMTQKTGSDGKTIFKVDNAKAGVYKAVENVATKPAKYAQYVLSGIPTKNITVVPAMVTTAVAFAHRENAPPISGGVKTSPTPTSPKPTTTAFVPRDLPLAITQVPNGVGAIKDADAGTPPTTNILDLTKLKPTTLYKSVFTDDENYHHIRWDHVLSATNATGPVPPSVLPIKGTATTQPIGKAVVQSYCLTTGATGTATSQWKEFGIRYKGKQAAQLKVAYRITDSCAPTATTGWTVVNLPATNFDNTFRTSVTDLNAKLGKYFQYQVNLLTVDTQVDTVGVVAQAGSLATVTSTPSAKPKPKASVTPTSKTSPTSPATPVAPTGLLLITTKKLVLSSPTPTAVAPATVTLPTIAPTPTAVATPTAGTTSSPKPSSSPVATVKPNPLCYNTQPTELVGDVPLTSIRQIDTLNPNPISITDQTTDSTTGTWSGLNGAQDTFPTGNYEITFDNINSDFVLVAFCDPDINRIIPGRSNATTMKAVVQIRPGQTTRLIALYSPRNKPYVELKKYAVPSQNQLSAGQPIPVLRIAYPGQKLQYLLRATNSGGETAKKVVLQDVIPSQYNVDLSIASDPNQAVQLAADPRGGTLVTITIGDLEAKQRKDVYIPVTLKTEPFKDNSTTTTSNDTLFVP